MSVTRTSLKDGITAADSYGQKHHAEAGDSKKDHPLSPPIRWSLAGTTHRPNPVGKGCPGGMACRGQPPSAEHDSEGPKWVWGWRGSQGEWHKQKNQDIWLCEGLQSYILSARVGESFYKNEAPCQHATI